MISETEVAAICKALADSNRLKIVKLLTECERCGCKLLEEFDITQPTLSHHMKILCESGLVVARKDGKQTCYSVNCDMFKKFQAFISSLSCRKGNL